MLIHRYQALCRDVLPAGDSVGFRTQRSKPGVGLSHLGPGPLPLCWLSSLVSRFKGMAVSLSAFVLYCFGYLFNFY